MTADDLAPAGRRADHEESPPGAPVDASTPVDAGVTGGAEAVRASIDRGSLVTDDPGVAADRLANGGVVAIPTETVYGLAADATDDEAIGRVFAIKGRPDWHPLIVHFASADPRHWEHDGWIAPGAASPALVDLANAFWPGPLTVIVDAGPKVSRSITGGRPTVGIRVPSHPRTERALALLGRPVAAPSANRFGRVSPTDVDHVLTDIGGELTPGIDAILDGGPTTRGVESTIVDLTVEPAQLLRHGATDAAAIGAVLGELAPPTGQARASGMLSAHYAPAGFVALAETAGEADDLAGRYRNEGLTVVIIDRSADPDEAARRLYGDLRTADDPAIDGLIVVLPPALGIGAAVRDRLRRAANGSAPPSRAR